MQEKFPKLETPHGVETQALSPLMIKAGQQYRYCNHIVTVRTIHERVTSGAVSCLVEDADGTFFYASEDHLLPLTDEQPRRDGKLKSLTAVAGKFLRQPSKERRVLR